MDKKRDQKMAFKISQISHKIDHMTPRYTQTNLIDAAIIQDLEKKEEINLKDEQKNQKAWGLQGKLIFFNFKNFSYKYKTILAY